MSEFDFNVIELVLFGQQVIVRNVTRITLIPSFLLFNFLFLNIHIIQRRN